MLDIFNNDAFSLIELTNAINILPNKYGKIGTMNLMPAKGVRTRTVVIEEQYGSLNLLPFQKLGAPANLADRTKRKARSFKIPHIPYEDLVLADEVEGVREFGSENSFEAIANVVLDHLQNMKSKHDITLEYLRMGALKGVILDASGSVLYNLYDEFGIEQKVINFDLDNVNTDVQLKCLELKRYIEKNLKGSFANGIKVFTSPEFFDKLISHKSVKEAYERWQDGSALRDDMRNYFPFCGITFEEYNAEATGADDQVRRFIDEGVAHAFPLGSDNFVTYFAPADFNETVNTIGIPFYAKQAPTEFDRGIKIHTQSNPLPICFRPALLVKLTA